MGADLMLMIRNCKNYYGDGTDVYQIASELEKIIIDIFGDQKQRQASSATTAVSSVNQETNGMPSSASHGSLNNSSVKNSSVGSV